MRSLPLWLVLVCLSGCRVGFASHAGMDSAPLDTGMDASRDVTVGEVSVVDALRDSGITDSVTFPDGILSDDATAPSDSGPALDGDPPPDAAPDGGPTLVCGTNCTCEPGVPCTCPSGTCRMTCSGAGCDMTCETGATCNMFCVDGGCDVTCQTGSTCRACCTGGFCSSNCLGTAACALECTTGLGCDQSCAFDADCHVLCEGGITECDLLCVPGAPICERDTCLSTGGCQICPR